MATPKQTKRDALRSATLGNKPEFIKRIVKWGGQEFEVRQPSIAQRSELKNLCSINTAQDALNFDPYQMLVWAVIKLTFVPGTEERVFEDEDFDELMSQPDSEDSFVNSLGEIAVDVFSIDTKKVKKSSKKTQKSS